MTEWGRRHSADVAGGVEAPDGTLGTTRTSEPIHLVVATVAQPMATGAYPNTNIPIIIHHDGRSVKPFAVFVLEGEWGDTSPPLQ